MILRLPGERQFEAYWLSNSPWRRKPVMKADGSFLWIYWGRFAFGFSRHRRLRRFAGNHSVPTTGGSLQT